MKEEGGGGGEEEEDQGSANGWQTKSPEIVEIDEEDEENNIRHGGGGGRGRGRKDVYVAVGKNDIHVVKWALDHLVYHGTQLFLVHVFPPITYISTTVGILSSSQLSNNQMQVYKSEEHNRRKCLLEKYIRLCNDAKANRPERYAIEITDETIKKGEWCVLIQVIERRRPMESIKNGVVTRYRNYVFTDMLGTRIPAVTFNNDIEFFERTLFPFKRYYIYNARVLKAKPEYQLEDYKFSWTLYNSTPVEPVDEVISPHLPCQFNFVKLLDLFKYAEQENSLDIKALVIDAFPSKVLRPDLAARDYVVIDEAKMPMIMRVWHNPKKDEPVDLGKTLPKPMLVVATSMKVTTFNGISLAGKYTSSFLENPPIHEDYPLKEWYNAHIQDIKKLLKEKSYRDPTKLLMPPTVQQIMSISDAVAMIKAPKEAKTAWVTGKIHLIPGQEKFWYTACSNCNKSLDTDYGRILFCSACQEQTIIQLRSHLEVNLTDETETITAVIYSTDAEKLMGNTAITLQLLQNEGHCIEQRIKEAIEGKHVVCFIKYHAKTIRTGKLEKYPVIKMYYHEEIFNAKLVDQTRMDAIEAPSTVSSKGKEIIAQSSASSALVESMGNSTTESQFFSPTAKTVLEEILDKSSTVADKDVRPVGVKRTLTFPSMSKNEEPDPASTKASVVTVVLESAKRNVGIDESPTKKAKN